MDMDAHEKAGFDQLETNAGGAAAMSRAKGVPSRIALAQLPQAVRVEVNAVRTQIAGMQNAWTLAALTPEHFVFNGPGFAAQVSDALPNFQGVHTNNAGWLPAVPVLADHIEAARNAIRATMTPAQQNIFNAANPLAAMGIPAAPTPLGTAYLVQVANQTALLNPALLRESLWGSIASGVSGYIEFNISGAVGRLVYDPIGDHLFLTAHYKWRKGYNPFFEIT